MPFCGCPAPRLQNTGSHCGYTMLWAVMIAGIKVQAIHPFYCAPVTTVCSSGVGVEGCQAGGNRVTLTVAVLARGDAQQSVLWHLLVYTRTWTKKSSQKNLYSDRFACSGGRKAASRRASFHFFLLFETSIVCQPAAPCAVAETPVCLRGSTWESVTVHKSGAYQLMQRFLYYCTGQHSSVLQCPSLRPMMRLPGTVLKGTATTVWE